jgi:hypothetical protein
VNRARLATLFRQIAEELAAPDTSPSPAKDGPKRKRPRPLPVMPAQLPTDLDRQVARQELRRLGYRAGVKR